MGGIGLLIAFWHYGICYIVMSCKTSGQGNQRCVQMPKMKFTWVFINSCKNSYYFESFLTSSTHKLCGVVIYLVVFSYKKKNNSLRRWRVWQDESVIDFEKTFHLEPLNRDSSSYPLWFFACATSLKMVSVHPRFGYKCCLFCFSRKTFSRSVLWPTFSAAICVPTLAKILMIRIPILSSVSLSGFAFQC